MSDLFLPLLPKSPMFEGGVMTREWQEFFRQLFDRVGGYDSLSVEDLGYGSFLPNSPDLESDSLLPQPATRNPWPEEDTPHPVSIRETEDQLPQPASLKEDLNFPFPDHLVPSPKLPGVVWDDIQFSVSTGKVPAANFPDYDSFTANTMAYKFDIGDYIDLESNELPHWWKEGTDVYPHIHVALDGANASGGSYFAKFTIYLAYAKDGGDFTEVEQDIEIEIPDGSVDLQHFIEGDMAVDFSSLTIGSQVNPRVERIAATGGAEYPNHIFILQVGLHAEKDSRGSLSRLHK